VSSEDSGKECKTLEVSSAFTRWFDADGFFVAKPFQQWLASEIPLIGQVDPQNKGDGSEPASSASVNPGVVVSNEQQIYDTPKKPSSIKQTTSSTKTRKGKKA